MVMDNSVLGKPKIDFKPIMVGAFPVSLVFICILAMYLNDSSFVWKCEVIVVLYLIYYSMLSCDGVCLVFLSQPEYMQEASLIMAKLCYVEGDYREALNQYSRVNLDEMQLVGTPVYRLSLIAEAYATKGK